MRPSNDSQRGGRKSDRGRGEGRGRGGGGRGRREFSAVESSAIATVISAFALIMSFQARAFALGRMAAMHGVEIHARDDSPKSGGGSTKSGDSDKKSGPKASSATTAPRLRGWDKPIVCNMSYSRRMSGYSRQERAGESGKTDGRLLSAAIAAIDRAYRTFEDPDPEELERVLSGAGEDLESIRGLWPLEYGGEDLVDSDGMEEAQDPGPFDPTPPNPSPGDQSAGNPKRRKKGGT